MQLQTKMKSFGKLIALLAGLALLLTGPVFGQAVADPWLILADGERGSVNARTTRQELVQTYGAKNVVDRDLDVGEGEMEPGTVLFPNDPERSIELLWSDTKSKSEPSSLTIRGNESRWKTLHDISLGTSLKQLEHLNGKAFLMSGYGWDYEGTVTSWDKGMLTQDLGRFGTDGIERRRIILRLTRRATGTINQKDEMQVQGDRDFSSDHPALQKMNPCVGEMVWIFPKQTKN